MLKEFASIYVGCISSLDTPTCAEYRRSCRSRTGKLELEPYSTALFLFCGRRGDRIKGLLWESDGFMLLYK